MTPGHRYFWELGMALWSPGFSKTPDTIDAHLWIAKKLRTVMSPVAARAASLEGFMAAMWVECAFPLIDMAGHKYAAALALTRVLKETEIKPPWPCFMVRLPEWMFSTVSPNGDRQSLNYVLVCRYPSPTNPDRVWSYSAVTDGGIATARYQATTSEMIEENIAGGEIDLGGEYHLPQTTEDERNNKMIGRLIANVCVAMSNPDEIKPIGKHPKGWTSGPGRQSKEPTFRSFRLGHPVTVDCRPAIQEYLSGHKGASPTVQFLVRGHWRQQPCGTKRSQIKTIWIEPYWKGPEDAPINVRPHVLREKKGEDDGRVV